MIRGIGCIAALLFSSASTLAFAADNTADAAAASSAFSRQRNVSVRERPRPDYEALGTHLGGFILFPKLTGEVLSDDNIFAQPTGEKSDTIFSIRPSLQLQSQWSRHSLQLSADLNRSEYADFKSESSTAYSATAAGQYDVDRFAYLKLEVGHARRIEGRSEIEAAGTSSKPIRYDVDHVTLNGSKQFNRLRLVASADLTTYDYRDAVSNAGLPIDQDFRDDDISTYSLRADYAISPDTFVFVKATYNQHSFDVGFPTIPVNRDSDGYELTAGADFDLTNLMRGQIEVGYLKQTYDAAQFGSFSGAQVRGKVEYFPTQLTTVTLLASRNVQDSGIAGAAGYLSSAAGLQVDHELLRNVILTARGDYERATYRGITRKDDRYNVSLGGTYLVNRNIGLSLTYNYLNQSSSGASAGFEFDDNRFIGTITLQY